MDLTSIRPLLVEAKASAAVKAIEALDRANALAVSIGAAGQTAHQAPHLARRRHHDLVVADVAAGREPDDKRLWGDVVTADVELERSQARHAAARDGVVRARQAAEAAVADAGPTVLRWLAANRPEESGRALPEQRSPRAKAWAELHRAIRWPALAAGPAADNGDVFMRYTAWWPLIATAAEYRMRRDDRVDWDRFAWAELAAGRFKLDGEVLSFERAWRPDQRSKARPVVFLDPSGQPIGGMPGGGAAETVVIGGPLRY